MRKRFEHFLCGVCGTPATKAGACNGCGSSDTMIRVVNGFLLEFPANAIPCPSCGSTDEPLVFRGWAQLRGFLYWARVARAGGYVCKDCARAETTRTLFLNA